MHKLKGVSVVVLGASGFMGKNLCNVLSLSGANVTGFSRQSYNPMPEAIRWVSGDFSNRVQLTAAIRGCEVVYHLIDSTTPLTSNEFLKSSFSNVLNTVEMLEICRAEGVRKVIFSSSGGTVYGVQNKFPISEEYATNPICAYGINKLNIEKYIYLFNYLHGIEFAILRISNPFGPHQLLNKSQGIIVTLISNHIKNLPTEIWGEGEVIRDYIYIDDVVDALVKVLLYSGQEKIFNVGSGVGRSINQLVCDIERIMNKGKINLEYTKLDSVIDVPVNVLGIDRIRKYLDWSPKISWEKGISMTVNWYLENIFRASLN